MGRPLEGSQHDGTPPRSMRRQGGTAPVLLSAVLFAAAVAAAAAIDGAPTADSNQTTVHVIFSSHLDVGFTDMDNAVIDLHFYTHYPRAIQLGRWFDRHGGGDRFRYLTHSWLISLFFDCPASIGITCPVAEEKAELADAIKRGYITWHAAPFNPNYEMFDADTLSYALNLTRTLDAKFGVRPKTVVSLRDVPGLTRAAVPVFASHGIRALTAGVNGFSAPPGVPKRTPFRWRDEGSKTELLAMWHEGGYGGWHNQQHVDDADDCIKAPGLTHVLCVSWNDDNAGPLATPADVAAVYAALRRSWPGARVVASTLEDFADALGAAAPRIDLPMVMGEMGDTWVHGSASDPLRMADYRAALRARRRCVRDPTCDSNSPAFFRFSRLIIKVAEHTWGLSFNPALGDVSNYTNAYLHPRLADLDANPGYARVIASWQRQRDYVKWALEELPDGHPIRADFEEDKRKREGHHNTTSASDRTHTWAKGLPTPRGRGKLQGGAAAGGGGPVAWLSRLLGGGVKDVLLAGSRRGAAVSDGGAAAAAVQAARGLAPAAQAVGEGGGANLVFRSHAWEFEVDPWNGGLSRLARVYSDSPDAPSRLGNDWAADAPDTSQQRQPRGGGPTAARTAGGHRRAAGPQVGRFLQLQYDVYNESDFQLVWDTYAFTHPVWTGDFGKYNLSNSSTLQAKAAPYLSDVMQSESEEEGLVVHLKYEFPRALVRDAGAPAAAWVVLRSPPDSDSLLVTVAWQNKTATRLPEAGWVRFTPGRGAVDPSSWLLYKIGSPVSPNDILINGSHSIHGVSEAGVTVAAAGGGELLRIRPHDAPLLALGDPRPFPNPVVGPNMAQGVSACLHNNVWGTNYAEWLPYSEEDRSLVFRFTIETETVAKPTAGGAAATSADASRGPASAAPAGVAAS